MARGFKTKARKGRTRKVTGNQKELIQQYRKQRHRVISAVSRLRREGYILEDKPVPSIPKKITTKSISRLEKITPTSLRKRAKAVTAYNLEGEPVKYVSGTEREKIRPRQKRVVKPRQPEPEAEPDYTVPQGPLEGQQLEEWQKYAIDTAPPEDKYNVWKYTEAIKNDDWVPAQGGFKAWLASIGEPVSAQEVYNDKLEVVRDQAPSVADWMDKFYQRYQAAVGEDIMSQRFDQAENQIPEFEFFYKTASEQYVPAYRDIAKMASIIKGSPLSGAEARALSKAIDKDGNG